jgi:hypothetical protein
MCASGDLQTPAGHAAIADTARHVLIPTVYEPQKLHGSIPNARLDTAEHLQLVYATSTLVTAVVSNKYGSLVPVSSSTKPDLMVRMLEILDIRTHTAMSGDRTCLPTMAQLGQTGLGQIRHHSKTSDLDGVARRTRQHRLPGVSASLNGPVTGRETHVKQVACQALACRRSASHSDGRAPGEHLGEVLDPFRIVVRGERRERDFLNCDAPVGSLDHELTVIEREVQFRSIRVGARPPCVS